MVAPAWLNSGLMIAISRQEGSMAKKNTFIAFFPFR